MRRIIGLVLVGLGVFMLVVAPLARFYAYPQIAKAPYDQNQLSVLTATNATVFDVGSLKEITTNLTTTARTIGDIKGSDAAPGNVTVWDNTSSTQDTQGTVVSRSVERAAFDRTSGAAVNCCGEYLETVQGDPTPVKHTGLVFKFPFNTAKHSYAWWDNTLLAAAPARYQAVQDVLGRTTYRFEQKIPATVVGTVQVPASLVGGKGPGTVTAQRVYSNVRTFWVEPNTGVVVDRSERQLSTLRYRGRDAITTTRATSAFTPATVRAYVDKYGPKADLLNLVRNVVPLVTLVAGAALVLIGLGLALTGGGGRRRGARTGPARETPSRPQAA